MGSLWGRRGAHQIEPFHLEQGNAYNPWANEVSQNGNLVNPSQCTGAICDASSSFYDAGARFHDPVQTGGHRFLGADPVGGCHAYSGDDPIHRVRPT